MTRKVCTVKETVLGLYSLCYYYYFVCFYN